MSGNMIFPASTSPACRTCADLKIPKVGLWDVWYGYPKPGHVSYVGLHGKIPYDDQLNCATQVAVNLEPTALV
jgi:hypothetical protein